GASTTRAASWSPSIRESPRAGPVVPVTDPAGATDRPSTSARRGAVAEGHLPRGARIEADLFESGDPIARQRSLDRRGVPRGGHQSPRALRLGDLLDAGRRLPVRSADRRERPRQHPHGDIAQGRALRARDEPAQQRPAEVAMPYLVLEDAVEDASR